MVKKLPTSTKIERDPETPNLLLVTKRKLLIKHIRQLSEPVWESMKRL